MRNETMRQDRWRVQVIDDLGRGRVTHESMFKSQDDARTYFDTIFTVGSVKYIEQRKAGRARYEVLSAVSMFADNVRGD